MQLFFEVVVQYNYEEKEKLNEINMGIDIKLLLVFEGKYNFIL